MQIWDNYVSISTWYKLNAMENVTSTTGVHTFHIIGICLSANMPATLHIVSHYTSTVFYI